MKLLAIQKRTWVGFCSRCTSGKHNIGTMTSNLQLLPLDVRNLQARLLATSFAELPITTVHLNLWQVHCSKGRSSARIGCSSGLSHCWPVICAFRLSDKLTHNGNASGGEFAVLCAKLIGGFRRTSVS
jgi:hypothetical protein